MNAKQTLCLNLLRLKNKNKSIRIEVSNLIDTLSDQEKVLIIKFVKVENLESPQNLWFNYSTQTWIEEAL